MFRTTHLKLARACMTAVQLQLRITTVGGTATPAKAARRASTCCSCRRAAAANVVEHKIQTKPGSSSSEQEFKATSQSIMPKIPTVRTFSSGEPPGLGESSSTAVEFDAEDTPAYT